MAVESAEVLVGPRSGSLGSDRDGADSGSGTGARAAGGTPVGARATAGPAAAGGGTR